MYDSKVVVDPILTNIALEYKNEDYVADKLFIAQTVDTQSGKYKVYPPDYAVATPSDLRAAGTVANEIAGGMWSLDNYYCTEHALQTPVTDEERKNNASNKLSPDIAATQFVTNKVLLGRENSMVNMVLDDTKYASGLTKALAGTAKWSAGTTSDPKADFMAARAAVHKKSLVVPNTMVIGFETYNMLLNHPKVLERLALTKDKLANDQFLATYFDVDNVIVSKAQSGAGTGMNITGSYIWPGHVLFAYISNSGDSNAPTLGREMVWGKPTVDRWREDPRKSDLVRYSRSYDLKFTGVMVGGSDKNKVVTAYLLKDVM